MKTLSYIAVHHSGSIGNDEYVSTAHLTFDQINSAHQLRWPTFKSSMGYYVGYNFIIDQLGNFKQFRALGETTAAQIGYNDDTISICLIGNFTFDPLTNKPVDQPTAAQQHTLVQLIASMIDGNFNAFDIVVEPNTSFSLSLTEIWPHRHYQQGTNCNGTYLKDSWTRDLVINYQKTRLSFMQSVLLTLQNIYASLFPSAPKSQAILGKVPVVDRGCDGHLII